jgi:DHA2 family multidrug resistance protein
MSADAAAPLPAEWKPSVNPWLIAISIMLATIMEVLDTSVANVSLPYIAGNLSASTDEATWSQPATWSRMRSFFPPPTG